MKKTKLLIMTLIMVMLPLSNVRVSAEPEDVPLETGIVDPSAPHDNPQREPVKVPEVSIEEIRLIWKMRTIPKTHQSDTEEKI